MNYFYLITTRFFNKKIFKLFIFTNLQIGTIVIATCLMSGLTPTIYGFDLSEKKELIITKIDPLILTELIIMLLKKNIAIKKLIESGKIKYIDSQL